MHREVALFPIQRKIDFLTSTEHLGSILQTQVKSASVDRKVIHEHFYDVFNEVRKYGSHALLESGGGVTQD